MSRNVAEFPLPDKYNIHTLHQDMHLQNGVGRVIPRGSKILIGGTVKKPQSVIKRGKAKWVWTDSGANRIVASWRHHMEPEDIQRIAFLDYHSTHATTEEERRANMNRLRREFTT